MSDLIAVAYPDRATAKVTPDKVLPEISQYGGEVLQTSLDEESEAKLREVLEQAGAAQAA